MTGADAGGGNQIQEMWGDTGCRKPKRSFFGKVVKWGFALFNILMLAWIVGGMSSVTQGAAAMSQAEKVGAVVGAGIGVAVLLGLWVAGDVILGCFVLFTRPKS
jgi:hypothetical protein